MDLNAIFEKTTRHQALLGMNDEELLFAALVHAARHTANVAEIDDKTAVLAEIFVNVTSASYADQVATVALDATSNWEMIKAVAKTTGINSAEVQRIAERGFGPSIFEAHMKHVAALPHGVALLREAAHREGQISPRIHVSYDMSILCSVVPYAEDARTIAPLVASPGENLSLAVVERIAELGAQDVIDEIALQLTTIRHDSARKAVIQNASRQIQLQLANDEELVFVNRKAALSCLSADEVQHIFETSKHDNVRNDAREVLETLFTTAHR
jgi:hypothetical protein